MCHISYKMSEECRLMGLLGISRDKTKLYGAVMEKKDELLGEQAGESDLRLGLGLTP